jgi:hypothetical protein
VNTKHLNAFDVNEKTFTAKAFTTPPATQTKPGLLSCQSFNHKNHGSDNTPTTNRCQKKSASKKLETDFCFY